MRSVDYNTLLARHDKCLAEYQENFNFVNRKQDKIIRRKRMGRLYYWKRQFKIVNDKINYWYSIKDLSPEQLKAKQQADFERDIKVIAESRAQYESVCRSLTFEQRQILLMKQAEKRTQDKINTLIRAQTKAKLQEFYRVRVQSKVQSVPHDSEELTLLEWWSFTFGIQYQKLPTGYLGYRYEYNYMLGHHTVEYFLPQTHITSNKITTYGKWKENLPIMERLAKDLPWKQRWGIEEEKIETLEIPVYSKYLEKLVQNCSHVLVEMLKPLLMSNFDVSEIYYDTIVSQAA